MKKMFLIALLSFSALLAPQAQAGLFHKAKPATTATPTPTKAVVASPKAAVTAAVTQDVPFVPSYEDVVIYSPLSTVAQPANNTYFATADCAAALMTKFGATTVELAPSINNQGGQYVYRSGPFVGQAAVYRMLVFPVGTFLKNAKGETAGSVEAEFRVNAGVLAGFYTRNPEADFPAQHSFTGYPPVPYTYLSHAEQGVWDTLTKLAIAAKAQADAAAAK